MPKPLHEVQREISLHAIAANRDYAELGRRVLEHATTGGVCLTWKEILAAVGAEAKRLDQRRPALNLDDYLPDVTTFPPRPQAVAIARSKDSRGVDHD